MATPVKKKQAKKKSAPLAKSAGKSSGAALYLYGISMPSRAKVNIRSESVDGESGIAALPLENFECWISRVDRREYAKRLAENMEDLEWLATVGVRHQRAVAELASKVEILPARFGTVFLSEPSLREHVKSGKKGFQAVFKKIAGSDEWGVKVFRALQAAPVEAVVAASGTDYLKKKAQSVMPRDKKEDPVLAEFGYALGAASLDTAPGGRASSGQPNLAWHGSFLVKRNQQKKFQAVLQEFTARMSERYRVECSGPWPPYSFVGQHG